MPTLTDFDVLSLDCYGTLIDWETGIRSALAPWLKREGVHPPESILEAFARHEAAQERETPSLLYPEVLATIRETGPPLAFKNTRSPITPPAMQAMYKMIRLVLRSIHTSR